MKVRLTMTEVLMGATVGIMRNIAAIKRELPDRNGHEGAGWNNHIEGACGEIAVAKVLNVFWQGSINTFKNGGDVGSVQVRTRSKPDYELIIRDNDDDNDTFYLVTGLSPNYEVVGKILARDAKRDEWIRSHGGRDEAWFVPHSALEKIDA